MISYAIIYYVYKNMNERSLLEKNLEFFEINFSIAIFIQS